MTNLGKVIEVMNGCICCTVRGDLVETLKRLHKRVETFDGVLIETTGLADPAPVVQTFYVDEDVKAKYKLDSVITVVDAKLILERLAEEKPEGVENEAVEQVCFADKILLNKVDLCSENPHQLDKIKKELKKLNPTAPVVETSYSKIDPKELLGLQAFSLQRVLDFDPEFLDDDQEHQHDESVTSVAVKVKGNLNMDMLNCWIERLIGQDGANLYRYKGVLAIKDYDKKFVFQGVGMMFGGKFESQWKVPPNERENRFVFIGKNLDKGYLRDGFLSLLDTHKLRFSVGDKVQANCGNYMPGTVIECHDQGNAYAIELDYGMGEVWAPIDVDHYVRKIPPPSIE